MTNDEYMIEHNLKPRGIEKWKPFSALEGFDSKISFVDEQFEYERHLDLDEQMQEEINYELAKVGDGEVFLVKYYANNKTLEIQGVIVIRDELIVINDLEIPLSKIIRITHIGSKDYV